MDEWLNIQEEIIKILMRSEEKIMKYIYHDNE